MKEVASMALSDSEAIKLADELLSDGRTEWQRLRRFTRYLRGRQRRPWLPDGTEGEYVDIAMKSASNWLELIVRATAQGLFVSAYGDATGTSAVWEDAWQVNGMDARQDSLHRATAAHGYGYLFVFPTDDDGVWMRPDAATNVAARYDDPSDDWPQYVARALVNPTSPADWWKDVSQLDVELYTDEARYTIRRAGNHVTRAGHEMGVCPVVQMRWSYDLLGIPQGEVEQLIPIQDRIVDATFTLQMASKYGAFPQRWIAGIDVTQPLRDAQGAIVNDAAGNPVYPTIKAYIDSILTAADKDTKFGQFQAADLKQYVEALEAHIRHLAAISQTPPHYLLGSMVNLSADAVAAAESGLQRKIREKRIVLGEGYEQALRLAAVALGDAAAAEDTSSQVQWLDVESRSLAQTSDALLKLRQLGVPLKVLLPMIPGFTQQDVDQAMELIDQQGGLAAFVEQMMGAQSPKQPALSVPVPSPSAA